MVSLDLAKFALSTYAIHGLRFLLAVVILKDISSFENLNIQFYNELMTSLNVLLFVGTMHIGKLFLLREKKALVCDDSFRLLTLLVLLLGIISALVYSGPGVVLKIGYALLMPLYLLSHITQAIRSSSGIYSFNNYIGLTINLTLLGGWYFMKTVGLAEWVFFYFFVLSVVPILFELFVFKDLFVFLKDNLTITSISFVNSETNLLSFFRLFISVLIVGSLYVYPHLIYKWLRILQDQLGIGENVLDYRYRVYIIELGLISTFLVSYAIPRKWFAANWYNSAIKPIMSGFVILIVYKFSAFLLIDDVFIYFDLIDWLFLYLLFSYSFILMNVLNDRYIALLLIPLDLLIIYLLLWLS
tara:strand:+ start:15026 stop:16096 length:1071 start_codon:yes stop_codon:yes gene_type:complete